MVYGEEEDKRGGDPEVRAQQWLIMLGLEGRARILF